MMPTTAHIPYPQHPPVFVPALHFNLEVPSVAFRPLERLKRGQMHGTVAPRGCSDQSIFWGWSAFGGQIVSPNIFLTSPTSDNLKPLRLDVRADVVVHGSRLLAEGARGRERAAVQ
jgi:hypothetical protein